MTAGSPQQTTAARTGMSIVDHPFYCDSNAPGGAEGRFIMGFFRTVAARLFRRRDRGLVFEAFADLGGRKRFVGFIVTTIDRAAKPLGFVPMDDYFLYDDEVSGRAPLVSKFDAGKHSLTDRVEYRRRLRLAKQIAADHRLLDHIDAIRLVGIDCGDRGDRRPLILSSFALLPIGRMPEHFSPFHDWIGVFSPIFGRKGPMVFGMMDVEAIRSLPQQNSGASDALPVATPGSNDDGEALTTAA